jgi:hypothetical protein
MFTLNLSQNLLICAHNKRKTTKRLNFDDFYDLGDIEHCGGHQEKSANSSAIW